jgi:hypothetical protein
MRTKTNPTVGKNVVVLTADTLMNLLERVISLEQEQKKLINTY